MRKEYGRALRTIFESELRLRLPQFEPVHVTSAFLWPGERAFRWTPMDGHACWILLLPDKKGREPFTIEVGWSTLGRFPELSVRPSPEGPNPAREEFGRDEYVCRLGNTQFGRDYWWEIERLQAPTDPAEALRTLERQTRRVSAEEASTRIAPLVDDALGAFEQHGLPYLAEWVAFRLGRSDRQHCTG